MAAKHPLGYLVKLDENGEAEVAEGLGNRMISRFPNDWSEVKAKIKTKPAKVVKKKAK